MFWGGWEKTAPAKLGKVTHVPIENENPLPIGWGPRTPPSGNLYLYETMSQHMRLGHKP